MGVSGKIHLVFVSMGMARRSGCFSIRLLVIVALVLMNPACTGPSSRNNNYTCVLGPEEIIYAPKDFWIDSPYFTYSWRGQTYGVLPSDKTCRTTDAVSSRIIHRENMDGLVMGAKGDWDELGAWLNGIYEDPSGRLHGYYHGEVRDNPILATRNRASLGYAYSDDGGKNWVKPNHPNNRIITGQNGKDYAGDAHLTIMPGGLFLYFGQTDGEHLAMSAFDDKGLPGTWRRFKRKDAADIEGSFSVPAMEGNGTPLRGLRYAAFVVWNSYLKKWLAVDADFKGEANRHLVLKVSDNGLDWKRLNEQLIPVPQTFPKLTLYPSLVGINGESETGKCFWLYYVYLTSPNTLARMKVTLAP